MSDEVISLLYAVAWDARLLLQNKKNEGHELGLFESIVLQNADRAVSSYHEELKRMEKEHD